MGSFKEGVLLVYTNRERPWPFGGAAGLPGRARPLVLLYYNILLPRGEEGFVQEKGRDLLPAFGVSLFF